MFEVSQESTLTLSSGRSSFPKISRKRSYNNRDADDEYRFHPPMLKRPNNGHAPQGKFKYWDPRNSEEESLLGGGKPATNQFSDPRKQITSRNKVSEAVNLFKSKYSQLKVENKWRSNFHSTALSIDAAKWVREEMRWFKTEKVIGPVPGVEVGDQFNFRALLCLIGLHCQFIRGIDFKKEGRRSLTTSIVISHRYDLPSNLQIYKIESSSDVLFYIGEGGNPQVGHKKVEDQKIKGGNSALLNSMEAKNDVRVIRKLQQSKDFDKSSHFVYDGLYTVEDCMLERGRYGKLVFVFKLQRKSGQPALNTGTLSKPTKVLDLSRADGIVSQGKKENAMQALNSEKTIRLDYTSATLLGEPSPSYKCPPTCKNSVGEQCSRYQLEIFKKQPKVWGVRSRNFIARGSFICEVSGVLAQEKEEGEIIDDEDDADVTVDDVESGNVGRFIKHSSSPNLYARSVLHDHGGNKIPHVMLYASENIIPKREFTLNYKIQ